jgi:hypothetical protein
MCPSPDPGAQMMVLHVIESHAGEFTVTCTSHTDLSGRYNVTVVAAGSSADFIAAVYVGGPCPCLWAVECARALR